MESYPRCILWPRKGAGHRIGVDLFHVKMPHLFGASAASLRVSFQSVQIPPQAKCQTDTMPQAFSGACLPVRANRDYMPANTSIRSLSLVLHHCSPITSHPSVCINPNYASLESCASSKAVATNSAKFGPKFEQY